MNVPLRRLSNPNSKTRGAERWTGADRRKTCWQESLYGIAFSFSVSFFSAVPRSLSFTAAVPIVRAHNPLQEPGVAEMIGWLEVLPGRLVLWRRHPERLGRLIGTK